jgi:hypothetical protein
MSSTSHLRTYLLLLLFLSASAFSQQTEQKVVSRTDSGFQYTTLQVPGSSATWATAVNNNGDIVGYYASGGTTLGFLFTNGVFQTISPCKGGGVEPMGINDDEVIVGGCNNGAFIYQNGNVTFLEHPKAKYTFLMGINNQGVMAGIWQQGREFLQRSFVYSNGAFTTINGLESPGGINNSNTISGTTCNKKTHVCKGAIYSQGENGWKSQKNVKYPGAETTLLGGINDNGDVVGYTEQPQDFLYNVSSKTFTGFEVGNSIQSQAEGINNSGEIVVWYFDGTTTYGF